MAVKTQLGFRLQLGPRQRDAGSNVLRQHVAGGIGDVDTVGTVGLHELELGKQFIGIDHVRHHQETNGIEAGDLRSQRDVLLGDIRLAAVRGNAN